MIVREGTPIAGGKYIVEIRLGKGGQAEVWKAQQLGVGGFSKDVVIKIVHAKALENPKVHQIFLNEAHLAAQLQHPNIVEIYDIGQHNELDYIVMELIRGQDLGRILETHVRKTGQPIPWTLVAQMMLGVCKGLHYAHTSKGRDGQALHLIHRDLKPENMLLTVDGFIKIIDFGMAKASNVQHKTQTGIIKGTPSYMSPEQITARPQDLRSDLFALGIIMYELCTGQRPFLGDMLPTLIYSILENHPEPLRKRAPRVPESFDNLVLKLLEKKPDDRYEDARQVQRALEKIIREDAPSGFHRDSLLNFAQRYAQPTEAPPPHEPERPSEPLAATDMVRPGYTPSPVPLMMYGNQTPNPMRQPAAPLATLFPENHDEAMEPTMSAPLEEVRKAAQGTPSSESSLTETQHRPSSTEISSPSHLPPGAVVGIPTEQTLRETVMPISEQDKLQQILLGYVASEPPVKNPSGPRHIDTKPTDPNAMPVSFSNEETEDLASALEANPDLLNAPLPGLFDDPLPAPPLPKEKPVPVKSPSSAILDSLSSDDLPEDDPLSFLDAFSAPLAFQPLTTNDAKPALSLFGEKPADDEKLASPASSQSSAPLASDKKIDISPSDALTKTADSSEDKEQTAPPVEDESSSAATVSSMLAVPDTLKPATQPSDEPGPESRSGLDAAPLEKTPLHGQDSAELQVPLIEPSEKSERKESSELAFQATAPLIEGISPEDAEAFFPPLLQRDAVGAEVSSTYQLVEELAEPPHRQRTSSLLLSDELSIEDLQFKLRHKEDTLLPGPRDLYEPEDSDFGGESTTIQPVPQAPQDPDEVIASSHAFDDDDEFAPTGILLPHQANEDDEGVTNIYQTNDPDDDFADAPTALRVSSPRIPSLRNADDEVFGNVVSMSQGEIPALSYRFDAPIEPQQLPVVDEEAATLRQGFSPLAGGAYDPNKPPPEYYQMLQGATPSQPEFSLELDEIAKEPHNDSGGDFTVLDVKLLERLQKRKQRLKWLWIGGNIIVILTLVTIILVLIKR
ncbi:MAG: serine/threonine protein kinase [Myxococcales bacterium]|nr:serine/threonine protein kinase [Myxococcales bacterium]